MLYSESRWTYLCGWTVTAWTLVASLVFSMPLQLPLTGLNFNYAPGGLAIVLLGSLAAWRFTARHWFQGPTPSISSSDAVRVKEYGWK